MTLEDEWCEWIEDVFWYVSGPLKHGGFLWPDLCELEQYEDLYMQRDHMFGGDELHCMREQIAMEYVFPHQDKLWPIPTPYRARGLTK